jgi:hypothetical protein
MKILPPIIFKKKIEDKPIEKAPLQTRGSALRNILNTKTNRIINKRK